MAEVPQISDKFLIILFLEFNGWFRAKANKTWKRA